MATTFGNKKEQEFQAWYRDVAKKRGLNRNPDHPKHYYDYRGFYKEHSAGKAKAGKHFPSKWKLKGHPRLILKGIDTRTGKPAK